MNKSGKQQKLGKQVSGKFVSTSSARNTVRKYANTVSTPQSERASLGKKSVPQSLGESIKALSPEQRSAVEERAKALIAEEKELREIRLSLAMSQTEIAKLLGVKQAEVSKMERRSDMYISTLRNFVEAMGGVLEINVSFPGQGTTRIKNLSSVKTRSKKKSTKIS